MVNNPVSENLWRFFLGPTPKNTHITLHNDTLCYVIIMQDCIMWYQSTRVSLMTITTESARKHHRCEIILANQQKNYDLYQDNKMDFHLVFKNW